MTPRLILAAISIQLVVVTLLLVALVSRPTAVTTWTPPTDIHVTVDPVPTDCWTGSGIYTACR